MQLLLQSTELKRHGRADGRAEQESPGAGVRHPCEAAADLKPSLGQDRSVLLFARDVDDHLRAVQEKSDRVDERLEVRGIGGDDRPQVRELPAGTEDRIAGRSPFVAIFCKD